MPRPRTLSSGQVSEIKRLYVDDAKFSQLALAFSVSTTTIRDVLANRGAYADEGDPVRTPSDRYRGNQKLSDENVREIRKLRNLGISYEELAVKFDINPTTAMDVCNYVRRFALIDPK